MSEEPFGLDATNWILPSTPDSKYAHAPNWSVVTFVPPQDRAACGVRMPAWDPLDFPGAERAADGKPPCPRCIDHLRYHLRWLSEWVESYENLIWSADG
jgi:hypothetical protein